MVEAMTKWDKRFMAMAKGFAQWSKDPKHQVGCIIVDEKNRVLSMGYNGPPAGTKDEGLSDEQRSMRSLHAEINAIVRGAGKHLEGATIYIYPYSPCAQCAGMIIQSGIKKVWFKKLPAQYPSLSTWIDSQREALEMFQEAGVDYRLIP